MSSNSRASGYPDLGDYSNLGTEMVTIHVGSGAFEKHFAIHKKLICGKSSVFEKMFDGAFIEAETQSATLPEDDPTAFASFVNWLYTRNICRFPLTEAGSCNSLTNLISLAEKYMLYEFLDRSITAYIWYLKTNSMQPSSIGIANAYKFCPLGSKYRLFMTKYLLYTWSQTGETNDTNLRPDHISKTEAMFTLLSENNAILADFIELGRNKPHVINPKELPACDFHHHDIAAICPYAKFGKQINGFFEI